MKQLDQTQIKQQAVQFQADGLIWHVHYFTPECALNNQGKYLTLLECSSEKYMAAWVSDKDDKTLIKELTQRLHNLKINKPGSSSLKQDGTSNESRKIIERAAELNADNISWHHHVLFPNCHFNNHSGKWTLMLEDPQSREILESLTDQEPKEDLKLLEPLFYAN